MKPVARCFNGVLVPFKNQRGQAKTLTGNPVFEKTLETIEQKEWCPGTDLNREQTD
jgi:hypothetical protein